MLLLGLAIERGRIRFFYKRSHAEQILVTFGLAIVLQEIVKAFFGANPIPTPAPDAVAGTAAVGALFGLGDAVVYPWWRLVYLAFSLVVIGLVFAFLQFTTFGMVVRAGMQDRETVGLLGINIERRFTVVFGIAAVVAGDSVDQVLARFGGQGFGAFKPALAELLVEKLGPVTARFNELRQDSAAIDQEIGRAHV